MKWKDMTTPYKILLILSALSIVTAMFLLPFSAFGLVENGRYYIWLFLAFSQILQSIISLKSDSKVHRIFSICMIICWSIVCLGHIWLLFF